MAFVTAGAFTALSGDRAAWDAVVEAVLTDETCTEEVRPRREGAKPKHHSKRSGHFQTADSANFPKYPKHQKRQLRASTHRKRKTHVSKRTRGRDTRCDDRGRSTLRGEPATRHGHESTARSTVETVREHFDNALRCETLRFHPLAAEPATRAPRSAARAPQVLLLTMALLGPQEAPEDAERIQAIEALLCERRGWGVNRCRGATKLKSFRWETLLGRRGYECEKEFVAPEMRAPLLNSFAQSATLSGFQSVRSEQHPAARCASPPNEVLGPDP